MTEVYPVFGEAAEFSEHKIGDRITYRQQHDWDTEPQTYSGEILWVSAATGESPIRYIVAPLSAHGFIDICMDYPRCE